jgi:hypothetical protein
MKITSVRLAAIATVGFGACAPLVSALTLQVAAQPAPIPDFSSGGLGWTEGPAQADYIAVPGSPSPITADPAHPHVENGGINRGKQPTFRIGDLSNPNLKQWAKDIMKKDNDEVLAGKIPFSARASCTAFGVPNYNLSGGGNIYFLQMPKEVVMIFDADAQVRRIYLNVPHSRNPKPSWFGESVGHYENGELVIDTIGFLDRHEFDFVDNWRTPHTKDLHVVERWKLINDGKGIEAAVTVEDPGTFNAPWSGTARWQKVDRGTMLESICAENNVAFEKYFGLMEYPMPEAKTPDF